MQRGPAHADPCSTHDRAANRDSAYAGTSDTGTSDTCAGHTYADAFSSRVANSNERSKTNHPL